jgi:hypothetical protein
MNRPTYQNRNIQCAPMSALRIGGEPCLNNWLHGQDKHLASWPARTNCHYFTRRQHCLCEQDFRCQRRVKEVSQRSIRTIDLHPLRPLNRLIFPIPAPHFRGSETSTAGARSTRSERAAPDALLLSAPERQPSRRGMRILFRQVVATAISSLTCTGLSNRFCYPPILADLSTLVSLASARSRSEFHATVASRSPSKTY